MRRIAERGLSREDIEARLRALQDKADAEPILYRCHHCRDTKFLCWEQHEDGHGIVTRSRPCPHCEAGAAILGARDSRSTRRSRQPTSDEAESFVKAFDRLCVQFGKSPTNELRAAFWDALKDYSEHELQRGFRHVVQHCKFFPKIAEILDGINGPPI